MPAFPESVSDRCEGPDDHLDRALAGGMSGFLGYLLSHLKNRPDAEDVLQDFCIRVLTRKSQLRDIERMDAWLYAVLRSSLHDHYRRQGRSRRLTDAFALEMASADMSAGSVEEQDAVCGCVRGLVSELRPVDAELIRRIDMNEETRASVAAPLEIRAGTLNVRLHRARAALRDVLRDHCGGCCDNRFDDCSCPPAAAPLRGFP